MKKAVICLITGVLLLLAINSQTLGLATASNEATSIQAANFSINQAFANVLIAEQSGGNVSGLLLRLDTAGGLLAEAENAYNQGTLANVNTKADSATLIANDVNTDAKALIVTSAKASQNNFVFTIVFFAVAATSLILALALAWHRFKRSYYKKVLGSKPEVVSNQT